MSAPAPIHTHVNSQGRIHLPTKMPAAMNLKPGSRVLLGLDDQGIRLTSVDQAIEHAQNVVAKCFGTRDLVGELLSDRRHAAQKEQSGEV